MSLAMETMYQIKSNFRYYLMNNRNLIDVDILNMLKMCLKTMTTPMTFFAFFICYSQVWNSIYIKHDVYTMFNALKGVTKYCLHLFIKIVIMLSNQHVHLKHEHQKNY